jgi:hypothetical protein
LRHRFIVNGRGKGIRFCVCRNVLSVGSYLKERA